MRIIIESILILLGIIMIGFGLAYRHKSKQLNNREELEWKTKSLLLVIYGCFYEIFILVLFQHDQIHSIPYFPWLAFAFVLGKISYTRLLRYFLKVNKI